LEVRFQVLARHRKYAPALELADQQVAEYPADFRGHMNRGNALFWLDRAQQAIEAVSSILDQHPKVAALPYNLACYWMKLGRAGEAIRWLECSMEIGHRKGVLEHALADPDLRLIWEYIRELQASEAEG